MLILFRCAETLSSPHHEIWTGIAHSFTVAANYDGQVQVGDPPKTKSVDQVTQHNRSVCLLIPVVCGSRDY